MCFCDSERVLSNATWMDTKCLCSFLLNAKACFSDTDLDIHIITVTDQGESGTTLNTFTGSKLLSAARQKMPRAYYCHLNINSIQKKIDE